MTLWGALFLSALAGSASGCGGSSTPKAHSVNGMKRATSGPAPKSEPAPTRPMSSVHPTRFAADLQALGLDPKNLPQMEALDARQVRRVMGLFTKSLGVRCEACHQQSGFNKATPMKIATREMWNQITRGRTTAGGEPIFCDSCHDGNRRFLDRRDDKALGAWMKKELVEGLSHPSHAKEGCASCHGDPFEPDIIGAWTRAQ